MNGKSGLFPSNFVKELDAMGDDGEPKEAKEPKDTNDATADEIGKNESDVAELHLCKGRKLVGKDRKKIRSTGMLGYALDLDFMY